MGASMTSAITGVSISSLPALAADGGVEPAGTQPLVSETAQAGVSAPAEGEVRKPAEVGFQVLDALLAPLIANTPNTSPKPGSGLGGIIADYAENAAPSIQGADSDSAGGGLDGSDDSSAPDSLTSPSEAHTGPQEAGGGLGKGQSLFLVARIIPHWHIIPRMK
jgi:hypothetical protein